MIKSQLILCVSNAIVMLMASVCQFFTLTYQSTYNPFISGPRPWEWVISNGGLLVCRGGGFAHASGLDLRSATSFANQKPWPTFASSTTGSVRFFEVNLPWWILVAIASCAVLIIVSGSFMITRGRALRCNRLFALLCLTYSAVMFFVLQMAGWVIPELFSIATGRIVVGGYLTLMIAVFVWVCRVCGR